MPDKNKTILVVEDEADQRQLLQVALEHAGYTVHTALSGEQALAVVESLAVDFLILDVMLSSPMDGLEVLWRLKANPATAPIPIMIVSAYLNDQRIKELLATGAELHMTKPYHLGVLVKTVGDILATREKRAARSKG